MSTVKAETLDDIYTFGYRLLDSYWADTDDSIRRDFHVNRLARIAQEIPFRWTKEQLVPDETEMFWYLAWALIGPIRDRQMRVINSIDQHTWLSFPVYNEQGVTRRVQRLAERILHWSNSQ